MDKEDYMRLPKERLAELLVERDALIKELKLLARSLASVVTPTYWFNTEEV